MLRNSGLNMNTEYPTNTPGQNARVMAREQEVTGRVGGAREHAALILLTQPGCGYCEAQRATLNNFKQRHGWAVREIDITQQPAAVTKFGTDYTPTTIMIVRDSNEWVPVAVGVESVAKIEESIYRSLRLLEGETTPQQFTLQQTQDGGVNDPRRDGK